MAFTPHNYDSPELPQLLLDAQKLHTALAEKLFAIQQLTGIPALHNDPQSTDTTPGILERLGYYNDASGDPLTVEAFAEFDRNETLKSA